MRFKIDEPDVGFADIRTYPPDEYPGLIIFRSRGQSSPSLLASLERFLPVPNEETVRGGLLIVEENGVRVRQ